jgi:RNA polymerase sigma factor (sigma-70 family)
VRIEPDTALVVAALAGDTESFAVLVERHHRRLRAVTRALLPEEAEDLAQEAILQAFLGLEHLREPDRFGAWLCGIAANLGRMRIRRLQLQRSLAWAPLGEAVDTETAALVREALGELAPDQRDAVLMHDVAGLTAAEIGTRVGRSPGAVRVRLHRGRRELRRRLSTLAPTTKEMTTMVEVELRDVVVRVSGDQNGGAKTVEPQRIVLLQERGGQRVLPIWIGAPEGDALALHLVKATMPRPLTAELIAKLLESLGASVTGVEVSSLRDSTFYAVIHLAAADGGTHAVDARPSDAINLAVRAGAPIRVEESVLDEAGLEIADQADLDREIERAAERHGWTVPEGTWESLSPDLMGWTEGAMRPK